ncbi:serine/threonine-protein kinase [Archangium sp. Cb G35]|uniref:serine/threonine-protein kinase n=1 Tax=Archangium sp. Cb G35 TaxID=1920190 RepID=UPI000B276ED7|nr:serine/threonine-protein kinase [Archangium sp. Cb G35]
MMKNPPLPPPPAVSQERVDSGSPPLGWKVAGRFVLEAVAGRGGMGTVYRARDALTGRPVALKLLRSSTSGAAERFTREAQVLATLNHPRIVSYVTHGLTEQRQPFLAMEWLEGEDLAQRLAHQPLSLPETLALLRHASEALEVAHRQGIVHRDLKPSNLFLRAGRPEDVVLLDFGLARPLAPSRALTDQGLVLGTPGYMAPEQASWQGEPTPSADIFSLGCVLYECLSGRRAFSAPHSGAMLAKILLTEPEALRTLRPELPQALLELVEHMLAKEPRKRPPDAGRLHAALEALDAFAGGGPGRVQEPPRESLARTEQQLVSILLAALPGPALDGDTVDLAALGSLRDSLRALLVPQDAVVEVLADGSLGIAFPPGRGTATDQVTLAARCALSLKERWPEASVGLATGRGLPSGRLPVGEAVDRAGQLLLRWGALPASATAHVLLDELSAGLLGPGFQLTRVPPDLFLLQGEHSSADASRPLLGRPTPCVGREQELALLERALVSCVEQPLAQAVLVTAPAGTGKSRLRHEFLRRLEHQGREVRVLMGRGEPLGTGPAGGLMGQALRELCGAAEGEPLEVRRRKLELRLARHLPAGEAREVIGFLGELCGIPFPDEHSPRLHAMRGAPPLLKAQVDRALVAFFQAECQQGPVLLVLEDLHWGDEPSVRWVGELLRALAGHPLLVLALARPEVHERFPHPWPGAVREVSLKGLGREACARLVHEVLGPEVAASVIERLVEQSADNTLLLEELIRGVAEGRGEAAPATVLAMLQARLSRLEPGERQVLLAASLFGRTFWAGGVGAVLGLEEPRALEGRLRRLEELELIEEQPTRRFAAEPEYRFRHELVRDAAYGLMPDGSKPVGHRLAGAWLERAGEHDPGVLAEHAWLGQQPERAIHFHGRMAEQLLNRHDVHGALRSLEAALRCGPSAEARAHLRALRAMAALWGGDVSEAGSLPALLPELRAGSYPWCKLMEFLLINGILGPQVEGVGELAGVLWRATPEEGARAAYAETVCFMTMRMTWLGARRDALAWLERLAGLGGEGSAHALSIQAWAGYAGGFALHHLEPRPWQALLRTRQSMRCFREMGWPEWIGPQVMEGMTLAALGELPAALRALREAQAAGERLGEFISLTFARSHLLLVLSCSPNEAEREEARALAREWVEGQQPLGAPFMAMARLALARVALTCGELEEAEAHARQACVPRSPYHVLPARTLLSTALLAQGRATEARREATLGVEELEAMGDAGATSVALALALAEACFSDGDPGAGEAALREAVRHVQARAADIPEAPQRERFLRQVPENARALCLALERGLLP